jgi:ribosomal protein S18 acetylase RimI-like enzyme
MASSCGAEVSIRAVSDADAGAIAGFFSAAHERDPVVGAISPADWLKFTRAPQNRGGRDFRVAVADGAIAGLATPSLRDHESPWIRHVRIVVTPEQRRRSIGSALLRHLAEMDAPNAAFLQCLCPARWEAMNAFLDASGFIVLEHELDMVCADAGEDRRIARRGEVTVRVLADPAATAEALAGVHNRAYAGTPSFVRLGGAALIALLGAGAVVLAAEMRRALVGFCHLEPGAGESWIESIAVEPSRQGNGIGKALLLAALDEAAKRTGPRVRLSVSDRNAAAYVLYRRLGFTVTAKSPRFRAPREAVLAALAARGR